MRAFLGLATALLALSSVSVVAQPYPSRPIQVVVSFPTGGRIDLLARHLATKLAENLGQPLVVLNRPGGNTTIAAESVARANPDGYTLLHALDATMTINPAVYANLPYDPLRDFTPVGKLVLSSTLLAVAAKVPARNVKELFEHARSNPSKLNYGAASAGMRLIAEQARGIAGIDIVHIPYKGTAPLVQALSTGEIDFVVDGVQAYLPAIKAGRVRPLATFGAARDLLLPDVPTIREAGYPDLEMSNWLGWFAPAGTPPQVVARLNAAIGWAFAQAEFRERIFALGLVPSPGTPEDLAAEVRADLARWSGLIRSSGLKIE